MFLWLLLPLSILRNLHLSKKSSLAGPGGQEALFWCLRLRPESSDFETNQVLEKEGSFGASHGSFHSQNVQLFEDPSARQQTPDSGLGQRCSPASPSRCSRKEQTPGKQTGAHVQFQATSSPSENSPARPLRFPLWEHLASR